MDGYLFLFILGSTLITLVFVDIIFYLTEMEDKHVYINHVVDGVLLSSYTHFIFNLYGYNYYYVVMQDRALTIHD